MPGDEIINEEPRAILNGLLPAIVDIFPMAASMAASDWFAYMMMAVSGLEDNANSGDPNQPAADAALLAGISEAAFYLWMQRGQTEAERLEAEPRAKPKASEAPFVEFLEAIKKAKPLRKRALLGRIGTASADPKSWQAAAWLLERSYPEEFGEQRKILLAAERELEKALDQLHDRLSPEAYADIVAVLAGENSQAAN